MWLLTIPLMLPAETAAKIMTSETVECERLEVILALAKKSTLHFKLRQESHFASPYATSVFT